MQKTADNLVLLIILATAGIFLLVVSFILIQVLNQRKILKQRQQLQEAQLAHQKELLQVVIESQEEERKRIGRDLHDEVCTAISGLRMVIEMLDPNISNSEHSKFVASSKDIIDKMMKDVRSISHNLSPSTLSYYGLNVAIEEQCDIINQSDKLKVFLKNDAPEVLEKLNLTVATAFYRVLKELLNNTIKHANATKSTINFSTENNLLIIDYEDDGQGMDITTKRGMGLQNIESRLSVINASSYVKANPGEGFYIQIKYQLA